MCVCICPATDDGGHNGVVARGRIVASSSSSVEKQRAEADDRQNGPMGVGGGGRVELSVGFGVVTLGMRRAVGHDGGGGRGVGDGCRGQRQIAGT